MPVQHGTRGTIPGLQEAAVDDHAVDEIGRTQVHVKVIGQVAVLRGAVQKDVSAGPKALEIVVVPGMEGVAIGEKTIAAAQGVSIAVAAAALILRLGHGAGADGDIPGLVQEDGIGQRVPVPRVDRGPVGLDVPDPAVHDVGELDAMGIVDLVGAGAACTIIIVPQPGVRFSRMPMDRSSMPISCTWAGSL